MRLHNIVIHNYAMENLSPEDSKASLFCERSEVYETTYRVTPTRVRLLSELESNFSIRTQKIPKLAI